MTPNVVARRTVGGVGFH